jgi:hypothetical protein
MEKCARVGGLKEESRMKSVRGVGAGVGGVGVGMLVSSLKGVEEWVNVWRVARRDERVGGVVMLPFAGLAS